MLNFLEVKKYPANKSLSKLRVGNSETAILEREDNLENLSE